MTKFNVPNGRTQSLESALHDTIKELNLSSANRSQLLIDLKNSKLNDAEYRLFHQSKIGHRAIGVVYDPLVDRYANYVPSIIGERYDSMIYVDESSAVEPIDIPVDTHDVPEDYPSRIG